MTREDVAPADALAGAIYAPAWRVVIAALRVWSRAGLLLVTALVVLGSSLDMTPLVLFRAVAVAAALPALAAWLLERAFAARLAVAEAVTLVGAWAAPGDVTSLRHRVERAWALSYYGGALLVLVLRLLP
jgi:hypothetical protein